MKELNIEDKAKRYDEAYKVAENIHRFSSDIAEIKRIEQIFPELKESEDEKIRKGLITFFSRFPYNNMEEAGINAKDVISWLEKQGEHDSIEEPNFFDNFRNSDVEVDSNEDGLIAETIRYKKEKQGEQKPVWSEEDKKVIHCLEYTIKHFYEDEDTVNWCCGWLKSLKDRYTWKPSDEQMNALNTCLIKGEISYVGQGSILQSLYDKLKTL